MDPSNRPRALTALLLAVATSACCGCAPTLFGRDVAVATPWPAAVRDEVGRRFEGWIASQGLTDVGAKIVWVALPAGDDPARLADARRTVDALLGVPVAALTSPARDGRLEPDVAEPERSWRRLARGAFGVETTPDARPIDPRDDAGARLACASALGAGDWSEPYARLVRARGATRRDEDGARAGFALVRGASKNERALAFERFLRESGALEADPVAASLTSRRELEIRPRGDAPVGPTPDETMVADLLGATLFDARDELDAAWAALERAGRPAGLERILLAPPTWPPESVTRLLERDGGDELAATLAEQLTTDPEARAWLTRSWFEPARALDGAFANELRAAAEGRLALDPRFRLWLRAEWTNWARRRYRRVARQAAVEAATPAPARRDRERAS